MLILRKEGIIMSLFLAPIHKLMYQKIHFLDDLTRAVAEEGIIDEADKCLGKVERGELAEVIDHNNIHGWLNEQVILTEKRFAYVVESLLATKVPLEEILEKMREAGKEEGFSGNAKEAFMAINSCFLDGMPCDRVLLPQVMEDEHMTWIITKDVHSAYWQDKSLYHKLRDAWTEGLLKESLYSYHRENDEVIVKRKDSK